MPHQAEGGAGDNNHPHEPQHQPPDPLHAPRRFGQNRDLDDGARIRLRQAIYIHGIVDAVLNDQVSRLPESSRSWVHGRRLDG